ncbi:MAG: NAD-dependent epimerase/dehydratase family protein [Coriobacteriales bacterium]|nr:NAD-dependent epimerase/dehydratase family protein [Coriobacteriales bacterium]
MRILVTGGAGFIGSNLVWALVAAGHDVGVIDDLSTGSPANLHPSAWFRTVDILDDSLESLVREFAPEAVVHLAAQSSVSVSISDPERDHAVNAEGTRRVALAARQAGARRMLSASSAAVYGEPAELPLREISPKAPINPYGASKLEAEAILAEVLRGSDTDFASMRFSNVYGPRQNSEGEGGVVAIFSGAIAADRPPVIFGDGKQTRDFIFVGDIVGAIVAALFGEKPLALDGPDGPAYNISTGTEISVNDLVRVLRSVAGYLGPIESAPARVGDIERSSLSPGKAAAEFGWKATSELEQGLSLTWSWFESQRP